jgi:SOS response regulatory protein OraA/RecX
VLDQLTAAKLLSEARFVEQFIRQHAARGQGPVRIRLELSQAASKPRQSKRRSRRPERMGGRGP